MSRRHIIVIDGLPPNVRWNGLKDVIRSGASSPGWVDVAVNQQSQKIACVKVKDSEVKNLYSYLAANYARIYPGHQLNLHIIDTSESPPQWVKGNCQQKGQRTCPVDPGMFGRSCYCPCPNSRPTPPHQSISPQQAQHLYLAPSFYSWSPLSLYPEQLPIPLTSEPMPRAITYTSIAARQAHSNEGYPMLAQYTDSQDRLQFNDSFNPMQLEGRNVKIRNLYYAVTESDIKSLFQKASPVDSVSICRDTTGQSQESTAVVAFTTKQDALDAIYSVHGKSLQKLYHGARLKSDLVIEQHHVQEEGSLLEEAMPIVVHG